MATVNKIKVGSTIYDVSPSPTGTLDNTGYTSGDTAQSSATSWTSVNQIVATETNTSIFTKITQMIRNVRYLYNLIGTGTFSTTNTITNVVNNKANNVHSHTTAQLPTSNTQINSTAYVPTSALVYSMNQTLNELNDAIKDIEYQVDNPNDRNFANVDIGTWSSTTDVNQFCNTYNYSNGYKNGSNKLSIGNRITIKDGTYNAVWVIAGFDLEKEAIAADGTTFDNGAGIALVPQTQLTTAAWNSSGSTTYGYLSSTMHTTTLPTVANNLKKVLGTHLVNRNVLLSSSTDTNGYANNYTWTTAYCTLMSIGQMTGTFASHNNKYDDGEANYKLPLFNFMEYKTVSYFWSRGISAGGDAWYVFSDGDISYSDANDTFGVRPLIYIR